MDLAKGDMEHLMKEQKPGKKLSEIHARPLLLGAAKGVEYLHTKRVCHRDLKLPNILYKSKRHALIADFSFAKETPHTVLTSTWIGTLRYQSPEILKGEEMKGYNPYSADTWAYGCCLYAAITGSLPFQALDKQQMKVIQKEVIQEKVIQEKVIQKEVMQEKVIQEKVIQKAQVSDQARDLLFKTMIYDEKDRIPFHNIINHEWFRCDKFTYQSWPQSINVSPPDPSAPVPPLLGI